MNTTVSSGSAAAPSDQRSLTRTYINDRQAGAAGGLALARRCEQSNRDSALGTELRAIVSALDVDATARSDGAVSVALVVGSRPYTF